MFRKKKFLGMGLATILMCSSLSGSLAYAESKSSTYDASFFENLKQRAIVHELQEHKIAVNPKSSIAELLNTADSTSLKSKKNSDLQQNLEKLNESEYIYLTLDGEVYSSEKGYVGMADKVEPKDDSVTGATYTETNLPNESYNNHNKTINSKNNPTPSQVNGGTTGAFSRIQLNFDGFDGVNGRVQVPFVYNLGAEEQPWMYFGFDSPRGKVIEGGFGYQTGRKVWQGYIRNSKFAYSLGTWPSGQTVRNVKFYIDKNTYDSYLSMENSEVVVMQTPFNSSDLSSMSLKRVISIAKDNFNGNNIYGQSDGAFMDLVVSKTNSDYYYPWENYSEYSLWDGAQWHGTIDWPTYYVQYFDNQDNRRLTATIKNRNR
ncbi:hypothetical protein J2T18_002976 [Paenibacillus polymyxa]|uniref:hypothetical protein n=1 Tax=Paenibacillus polymyxa TaxID=1406 RepID=UPI002790F4DE|nr:hypothetical protein [Paenibacillus polymyxa]MDQ0048676.1 hypothetical protein [Paenibacillus polymyxa]